MFRELPGYSGWVVVEAEQDPAKAHPLTYAKLGYKNLRGYLRMRAFSPGRPPFASNPRAPTARIDYHPIGFDLIDSHECFHEA